MTGVFISGIGKTLRFREPEVILDILMAEVRKAALTYEGGLYGDVTLPRCFIIALRNLGGASGLARMACQEFFGVKQSEMQRTVEDCLTGFANGALPELPKNYINNMEFGYFFGGNTL